MDSAPNWQFSWMAPLYDWLSMERQWEQIEQVLQPGCGGWMLDLGGGTGQVADYFRTRYSGDDWLVVDRNRAMVREGRESLTGLRFVQGDGLRIPCPDETFERVFMGDAFHHVHDRRFLLRDIHRVLHPSGSFVLEEFDPSRLAGALLYGMEQVMGMGSRFFRPDELADLLEECGFVPLKTSRNGFVYYLRAVPETAFAAPDAGG